MYYRDDNNEVIGVLNDYDLASQKGDPPRGNQRTGTIPFMALDLLRPDGQSGKVEHVYRHDLESFIWVLVWLTLLYKDGEKVSGSIDDWAKVDANSCYLAKLGFLNRPPDLPDRVYYMVLYLQKTVNSRSELKMKLKHYSSNNSPRSPQESQKIKALETKLSKVSTSYKKKVIGSLLL